MMKVRVVESWLVFSSLRDKDPEPLETWDRARMIWQWNAAGSTSLYQQQYGFGYRAHTCTLTGFSLSEKSTIIRGLRGSAIVHRKEQVETPIKRSLPACT